MRDIIDGRNGPSIARRVVALVPSSISHGDDVPGCHSEEGHSRQLRREIFPVGHEYVRSPYVAPVLAKVVLRGKVVMATPTTSNPSFHLVCGRQQPRTTRTGVERNSFICQ